MAYAEVQGLCVRTVLCSLAGLKGSVVITFRIGLRSVENLFVNARNECVKQYDLIDAQKVCECEGFCVAWSDSRESE